MNHKSKSLTLTLIVLIAALPLILIGAMPFGLAQSGTNVSYIIGQDTTWTVSGSPYTLTGNTLVYQGVTLTIQAGVTVNLGSYYIEVNGTLSAIGNPNAKITFNGGQIIFTTASNGWNEQTNSGCLIENSIISQTSITSSNPIKIDNCIINSQITVASSVISNNIVTGDINSHSAVPSSMDEVNAPVDTSVISGNEVNGNIAIGGISLGILAAPFEACSVFNNTVDGSIMSGSPQDTPQIYNNTVSDGGIQCTGYSSIFNNYVYGCQEGISLYTQRVFGGELPCYATVENNLVIGNSHGIDIELTSVFGPGTICPTVSSNTISGNSVGIYLSESYYDSTPIIVNNNVQNNSDYNFYLQASNNVNASYNWWGTTSQQAINQTIYDFKEDFNLGTVNFVPFSMTPNSQAPVVPTLTAASTPTPPVSGSPNSPNPTLGQTPTSTPTQTPTTTAAVPELSWLVIVPLLLSVFSVAVFVGHRKVKYG